ncbi:Leucine-rich repeat activity-regulated protein at synapses [Carabus blaptoides fortunei]
MFRYNKLDGQITRQCIILSVGTSRIALPQGRCSLSYYQSMRLYDCVGLNLSQIPTDLSTSTEIIDISMNRIRELTNNSFKVYTYLKKLYLNDNMIMTIEPGTFDGLDDLDTLDLSMNALIEVPVSIFHLHSLETLMLGKNIRLDIVDLFKKASPISAPLQYLDISYNPMLTHLPRLEVMMDLVTLNVTGNHLTNVSMANFIGLCNLQYFINDNLTIDFNSNCDCHMISDWFEHKSIKSNPQILTRCVPLQENEACHDETDDLDKDMHDRCVAQFASRQYSIRMTRIMYIALGIIAGVIALVGICYFYYRWQRLPDEPKIATKHNLQYEKSTADPLIVKYNDK